jgi:hypothetical protein
MSGASEMERVVAALKTLAIQPWPEGARLILRWNEVAKSLPGIGYEAFFHAHRLAARNVFNAEHHVELAGTHELIDDVKLIDFPVEEDARASYRHRLNRRNLARAYTRRFRELDNAGVAGFPSFIRGFEPAPSGATRPGAAARATLPSVRERPA